GFNIRAGNPTDMNRLMASVAKKAPQLAGIIHLWSLDAKPADMLTNDELTSSARLGCISVMHLLQAIAGTDGVAIEDIWLVTHAAQPAAVQRDALGIAQSPLWGFARVAGNEYRNLRCRLGDLSSCSSEEIASLAGVLCAPRDAEDECSVC